MIKILFADDDLKYSMLLKSFLQQHGYDVTYAGNGKKAWEQFPEVKPDLVLLDINMPEMDGYEVAERIRTIDPKVLIFFLTDRTEKNDRLKGFSLKANDYLAKPFYPEELLARIEGNIYTLYLRLLPEDKQAQLRCEGEGLQLLLSRSSKKGLWRKLAPDEMIKEYKGQMSVSAELYFSPEQLKQRNVQQGKIKFYDAKGLYGTVVVDVINSRVK